VPQRNAGTSAMEVPVVPLPYSRRVFASSWLVAITTGRGPKRLSTCNADFKGQVSVDLLCLLKRFGGQNELGNRKRFTLATERSFLLCQGVAALHGQTMCAALCFFVSRFQWTRRPVSGVCTEARQGVCTEARLGIWWNGAQLKRRTNPQTFTQMATWTERLFLLLMNHHRLSTRCMGKFVYIWVVSEDLGTPN